MMIDFIHVEGHLSVSHILLQMAWRTSTTGCPPCVISSAGTLSTPAVFPNFRVLMADSTFLRIGKLTRMVIQIQELEGTFGRHI